MQTALLRWSGLVVVAGLAVFLVWALTEPAAPALEEGGRSYAGLGDPNEGFAPVRADTELSFPQDLGPHPDFRIEWWYLTANLTGSDGQTYGAQWTLFRNALAPPPQREGWASQQFWLAHAAVTTRTEHVHAERLARGGVGQAGATDGRVAPFKAWLDHWSLQALDRPTDSAPARYTVSADGARFAYSLELVAEGPIVLQGDRGYSVKSDTGQASYYFSQPFFAVTGTIALDGRDVAVSGRAWMDREWSSQPLAPDQEGWDWFSLHLGTGEKVMLFRLRHTDGRHYYAGNWITPDGASTPLPRNGVTMTPGETYPIDGRPVPVAWRIEIPSRGVAIETAPLNPAAWNATRFAYWEGPITISGSHTGEGYLEMTGY